MAEEDLALPRPGRRLKIIAYGLVALAVVGGIGGEMFARYGLGLGDPPLYQLDPDIEYMLVPSKAYRRFGNAYEVNAYSMRSRDFPSNKGAPDELRVLVVGDSIVNGGSRIDQAELATELVRRDLEKELGRPVTVGNASAASWGPPNELAYLKRFGVLEADVVLLVLNSDDIGDVPGLEVIGAQWPRTKPSLALEELFDRYGTRLIERAMGRSLGPAPKRRPNAEVDIPECLGATKAFFELARSGGARVGLVQYLKRSELAGKPQVGYGKFRELAEGMGVPVFSTGEAFGASLKAGVDPYLPGDDVHASAAGQRVLAGELEDAVRGLLGRKDGGSGKGDSGR